MQRAFNIIIEKSAELGLKINIHKINAMMVKDRLPAESLVIDQTQIGWVSQYMYLGIIIDSQFKFPKEVTHLKQRASSRLSIMKHMTSLNEGPILRCGDPFTLLLLEPLLIMERLLLPTLTENLWSSLEVLQNNAIQLMLAAPMWTRLCNFRMETNPPTFKNRVAVRNSAIIAKALLSDKDSLTRRRAVTELNRHPDIQGQNIYIKGLVKCTKDLGMTNVFNLCNQMLLYAITEYLYGIP